MPSYSCTDCGERMTLKKASADKKKCPTCHNHSMEKDGGMGMVDESVFGF